MVQVCGYNSSSGVHLGTVNLRVIMRKYRGRNETKGVEVRM